MKSKKRRTIHRRIAHALVSSYPYKFTLITTPQTNPVLARWSCTYIVEKALYKAYPKTLQSNKKVMT
jgi:hypothetical protein